VADETCPGVLPVMVSAGRLRLKGLPFSGLRDMEG